MQPTRRSCASLPSSAWLNAGWQTPVPEGLFPTTRWLGGFEHGRNNMDGGGRAVAKTAAFFVMPAFPTVVLNAFCSDARCTYMVTAHRREF